MTDSTEWIKIGTYATEAEASLVAGMLRTNDIPAIVNADRMSTLYGSAMTWAPITISVPRDMADKAAALVEASAPDKDNH